MISAVRSTRQAATRTDRSALELARRVLAVEAQAVHALVERLDARFLDALHVIQACIDGRRGRVIVSGIGKSGHIARKIASTMASTGTPAYFVHPAEASHGDLGMIRAEDVFIGISHSGESAELLRIVPAIKREGAKLLVITGKPESSLAREADVLLDAAVSREACPHNLAPTASTTAALALGDALAIALLDARGFSAADFARSHPGGALHREALKHVADVMHRGAGVPVVRERATLKQALDEMTRGGLGMTAVVDGARRVKGIFTDGDLRRALKKGARPGSARIARLMTPGPRTIVPDALAAEAVALMERHRISQLLVVNAAGELVGALNMNDLLRAKVV
ncbi:MAG: KpsF/GutQ family sugar-phosphate isomerase [Betaproteobacteria bacterium]|nr:KpsF/GutQ family sugar-phosphate isomerase [Betaproteobacteria bacterium]MDH5219861.1 KpsF/GutQ family sugar-phosphate isomerase [Betaproteobacteria bacterium]MDH5349313.1 KpsF/GutQ family sugar-phosphate isomerase [Betaproteobacteria bacterium]